MLADTIYAITCLPRSLYLSRARIGRTKNSQGSSCDLVIIRASPRCEIARVVNMLVRGLTCFPRFASHTMRVLTLMKILYIGSFDNHLTHQYRMVLHTTREPNNYIKFMISWLEWYNKSFAELPRLTRVFRKSSQNTRDVFLRNCSGSGF